MTTLKIISRFSSAAGDDFVSTDAAELASHMDHCASSRSRFFVVHSALQITHSFLSPRVVTAAALVLVGTSLFLLV